MKIAITGAEGFIGSALYEALTAAGHTVYRWIRNPKHANDRVFRMPEAISSDLFVDKPDWVIHAAYVTQFTCPKTTWQVNVEGSLRLFSLSEAHGAKVLFLSSLSAHPQALSIYGRSKWHLESYLDLTKHLVVKPGIVVGNGGLFLRMTRLVQRLRFAVVFWGGEQPMYSIALTDLLSVCQQLMEQNRVGRYHVMAPEAYTVKQLYGALMRALCLKPRTIGLPGTLSLWAVQCIERLRFYLPVSSENLLGLKQACLFTSDCEKIGYTPLGLEESIQKTVGKEPHHA